MTRKLYYDDSRLSEFEATVLACQEDGKRFCVTLDATAFYPEGGGQPPDLGTIGDAQVLDVQSDGELVLHFVSAEVAAGPTHCSIDWARRWDHTQQHTAQHLLSAVTIEVADLPTVSFHLGAETCTIDLHGGTLTPEQITAIEERANAIIQENRPVGVLWPSAEEAAKLPLRKALAIDAEQQARVVVIADLDYNGCGGTHVRNTGEIGLLKIMKTERVKGGLCRVHWIAGMRAIRDYSLKHEVSTTLARSFSSQPAELVDLVDKLRISEKQLRKEVKALKQELIPGEARKLLLEAEIGTRGSNLLLKRYPDRPVDELKLLATELCKEPRTVCVLATETDGKVGIILRHSGDLPINLGQLLREAGNVLPIKGGGQADNASAGGSLSVEEVGRLLELFREYLS